jgi:serine/threonine protein kinase
VQKVLLDEVIIEAKRLERLSNDHIITYKEVFYDSADFNLNVVMELCKGSLRSQIKQGKNFTFKELQSFLIQINSAFL